VIDDFQWRKVGLKTDQPGISNFETPGWHLNIMLARS